MIKEYSVYLLEMMEKETTNEGWIAIVDPTNAGLQNVDFDWIFFGITIVQSYYPRTFKYLIGPNPPLILQQPAKIVINFCGEEIRSRIRLPSTDELKDYIPEEAIPESMKRKQSLNSGIKLVDLGFSYLG